MCSFENGGIFTYRVIFLRAYFPNSWKTGSFSFAVQPGCLLQPRVADKNYFYPDPDQDVETEESGSVSQSGSLDCRSQCEVQNLNF